MKDNCWNCKFRHLCYAYNNVNIVLRESPYLTTESNYIKIFYAMAEICTQYQREE